MDVDQQVAKAISQFSAWERPWEFHNSVLRSPHLEADGRAAFERIWSLASDDPSWRQGRDLAEASETVSASLQATVPSLDSTEIASIVRAVSYDWR